MKEKKHRKIITRRQLSKEEVSKGKDFNALLGDYQKTTKPLYRNPKVLRAILLIFIILLVLFIVILEEKK